MKILIMGDTILSRSFFKTQGYIDFLERANSVDLVTFNLETTVSEESGNPRNKSVHFKTSKDCLNRLLENVRSEVIVNIANNHIMDYGKEVFRDTVLNLEKSKAEAIGMKNCYCEKVINGSMVAVTGAFLCKGLEEQLLNTSIEELLSIKEQISDDSNLCIAHIHWGEELSLCPSPKQIEQAHTLIDKGYKIVIGHHPHVIQGIEEYNGGLIIYSMGNFQIPTNEVCEETQYSHILEVELENDKIVNLEIIPVMISDSNPNFEKTKAYEEIYAISDWYLKNNNWKNYYCAGYDKYFKDSMNSWRLRKKSGEKIAKPFLRWLISKHTIIYVCIYVYDKVFKYTKRIRKDVINGAK